MLRDIIFIHQYRIINHLIDKRLTIELIINFIFYEFSLADIRICHTT